MPIPVTVTVSTDDIGSTTKAVITLAHIVDVSPPNLKVLVDKVVNLDAAGKASLSVSDIDDGSADNCATPTLQLSPAGPLSFTAADLGDNSVTLTGTDAFGNTSTLATTVSVIDALLPTVVAVDIAIALDASGMAAITATQIDGGSTDNVALASLSVSPSVFTGADLGPNTVTLTVTDTSGNAATATAIVTVTDDIKPVIAAVPNNSVDTDAGLNTALVAFATTVSDNADAASHFTPIFKIGSDVITSPYDFAFGVTTVSVTANADTATNVADAISFTVTVSDDGTPVFAGVPVDITQNTDAGVNTAVVNFTTPTAVDAVDGAITPVLVSSPTAGLDSGSTFPLGVTTLTYTATDVALNVQTASFTITISDVEKPVIAAVTNQSVNTDAGLNTALVAFATTVSDNTDAASHFTPIFKIGATTISSPYDFPAGETAVSVTANADTATNVADAISFTVTVTDDGAPVFAGVPVDITQNTDTGVNTAVVNFTTPTVEDAVDGALTPVLMSSPTAGLDSGSAFSLGVTTLTYTATDAALNVQTASFTITISDTEKPVIAAVSNKNVDTDAGLNTASVAFATTVSDNADAEIAPVFRIGTDVITSPHVFLAGETIVTIDANDSQGNIATQDRFTVIVNDKTAPNAPAVAGTTVLIGGSILLTGTAEPGSLVSVTFPDGSVKTNTAASDGSYSINSEPGQPNGAIIVTSTDAAGNKSGEISFEVVVDLIRPEVVISAAPGAALVATSFETTIRFSEDVTGFMGSDISVSNATLTGLTGGPALYTASLRVTGVGDVVLSIPAGIAVDTVGNSNKASNMITIVDKTVANTQVLIAQFQQSRANQLLNSQPELISFFGADGSGGSGKFNASVTRGNTTFNFSSGPGKSSWMVLNGSWSSEVGKDTGYLFGAFGRHFNVNPDLLVGGMLQFDHVKQDSGVSDIKGSGWMVGPYFVARSPTQPLFFEGRAMYGQTSNVITPFGTYTDNFESERWLLQAKVAGELKYGSSTLMPNLDFSYTTDAQQTYTDGLGNIVSEQMIKLGQIAFGLDFAQPVVVARGELQITGGLSGIWSHTSGTGTASTVVPTFDGGRAKIDLGVNYFAENGGNLNSSMFYDGIGASGYESYGVSIGYQLSF